VSASEKTVACPCCGKRAILSAEQNPWRPFCSKRCKMIDLGAWADGSYRIPDTTQKPTEEDAE